jgi:serine/threonine-protein kinase
VDPDSSDDFLRELARAPERAPDPERVAHFRIVARLGQGGMGVVYRAEDEKLHRVIALKVLVPREGNEDEQRKRFLREARAAARLTHPNIAVVHEVGEDGSVAFIAMELVEGTTLRAILRARPLPFERVVPIALQIARALECAHDAKIVHRDLKPENVIVGKDDLVKIVDFGLAKQSVPAETEGFQTDEGRVLGTPAYMSPEQARGKEVTAASDVFAFGVMLHEMITGTRPFAGASLVDLMVEVERGRKRTSVLIRPDVNALLDDCLTSKINQRLPNGGRLVQALQSLSSVPPRRGRNVIVVAIGVGVVAVGAIAWVRLRGAPDVAPANPPPIPCAVATFEPTVGAAVNPAPTPFPSSTQAPVRPRSGDSIPKASALPSSSSSAPRRHDFDRQ